MLENKQKTIIKSMFNSWSPRYITNLLVKSTRAYSVKTKMNYNKTKVKNSQEFLFKAYMRVVLLK